MTYLDSAVLVKLFLEESDSYERLEGRKDLCTSVLALPELKSAIRRNLQAGVIHPMGATRIWKEFLDAGNRRVIRLLPISEGVMSEAARTLERLPLDVPLRSLDAIHLATVILNKCDRLATTDRRMLHGANALAVRVVS